LRVQVLKDRLTVLDRPTPTHDDAGIACCVVSTRHGWLEDVGEVAI
jgi:hypothetical protein